MRKNTPDMVASTFLLFRQESDSKAGEEKAEAQEQGQRENHHQAGTGINDYALLSTPG